MATIRILRSDGTRSIRVTETPMSKPERDALRRALDGDKDVLLFDVLSTTWSETWAPRPSKDFGRAWSEACRHALPFGAGKRGQALRHAVHAVVVADASPAECIRVTEPSGQTVSAWQVVCDLVGPVEAQRVFAEARARLAD